MSVCVVPCNGLAFDPSRIPCLSRIRRMLKKDYTHTCWVITYQTPPFVRDKVAGELFAEQVL